MDSGSEAGMTQGRMVKAKGKLGGKPVCFVIYVKAGVRIWLFLWFLGVFSPHGLKEQQKLRSWEAGKLSKDKDFAFTQLLNLSALSTSAYLSLTVKQ